MKLKKTDSKSMEAPASPKLEDYKTLLTDVLTSPNTIHPAGTSISSRTFTSRSSEGLLVPSSREWFTSNVGVVSSQSAGGAFLMSPMSPSSSGTRGANNKKHQRKTNNFDFSVSAAEKIDNNLFGDGNKSPLSAETSRLLRSPSDLSPHEGHDDCDENNFDHMELVQSTNSSSKKRKERINMGIAFKGITPSVASLSPIRDTIAATSKSSDEGRQKTLKKKQKVTKKNTKSALGKRSGGEISDNDHSDSESNKNARVITRVSPESTYSSPDVKSDNNQRDRRNRSKGSESYSVSESLMKKDSGGGSSSNAAKKNKTPSPVSSSASNSTKQTPTSSDSLISVRTPVLSLGNSHAVSPNSTNSPSSKSSVKKGEYDKSKTKCNCRKTKCLKLYCDCFRITKFCDGCNCTDCSNSLDHEAERNAAVSSILERNPEAFAPRIKEDPNSQSKGHLSGCHCKKSACLKKYCECFSASVPCSNKCRCLDCKNTSDGGSSNGDNFPENTKTVSPLQQPIGIGVDFLEGEHLQYSDSSNGPTSPLPTKSKVMLEDDVLDMNFLYSPGGVK